VGARAEDFAPKTRFAKERLWHVEITFAKPLRGPLLIGDGRYLGLGQMSPQRDAMLNVVAFAVPADTGIAAADGFALAHAVRSRITPFVSTSRTQAYPSHGIAEDHTQQRQGIDTRAGRC
jgi:hypothetical protein